VFKVGDEVFVTYDICSDGKNRSGRVAVVNEIKNTGVKINKIIVYGDDFTEWVPDIAIRLIKKGEHKMVSEDVKCCVEKSANERGLYEIIVVNPTEDGEIILAEKVVARDKSEAKFVAGVKEILKEKKLRLGDVDIIVYYVGSVRPYETETKVKIVGSVDGFSLVKKEK